ncbi:unnamed protein product [Ambrosiozyma monospora]|uniref:Unnamed protein product n=1 Tax=Ambrosiozyma monospora TaxID=43982 RepID=A0ACB5TS07_AMBMO|nr:unnamed protein product [Ambrosiozyma monospora]
MTQGYTAAGSGSTLDPRKLSTKRTPTSTNPVPMITKLDELETVSEDGDGKNNNGNVGVFGNRSSSLNNNGNPYGYHSNRNSSATAGSGSNLGSAGPSSPAFENHPQSPSRSGSSASISAAVGAVGRRVMSLRKNKD